MKVYFVNSCLLLVGFDGLVHGGEVDDLCGNLYIVLVLKTVTI